jgi:hypothetical protein
VEEPRKTNASRGELGSYIRDGLSACYPTLDDRHGLWIWPDCLCLYVHVYSIVYVCDKYASSRLTVKLFRRPSEPSEVKADPKIGRESVNTC